MKAKLVRNKSKAEIAKQLEELKQELASLKVAKVTGGAPAKLGKMWVKNQGTQCLPRGSSRSLNSLFHDENLRFIESDDLDR